MMVWQVGEETGAGVQGRLVSAGRRKKNGFGVELGVAVLAGEKKEKKSDEGGAGLVDQPGSGRKKNQKMGVGWPDAEGKKKIKRGGAAVWFQMGGRWEKRKNVMAECVGLWRPKINSPGGEE